MFYDTEWIFSNLSTVPQDIQRIKMSDNCLHPSVVFSTLTAQYLVWMTLHTGDEVFSTQIHDLTVIKEGKQCFRVLLVCIFFRKLDKRHQFLSFFWSILDVRSYEENKWLIINNIISISSYTDKPQFDVTTIPRLVSFARNVKCLLISNFWV